MSLFSLKKKKKNPTLTFSSSSKTRPKQNKTKISFHLDSFHPYFSLQKSRKKRVRLTLIKLFVFLRIRARSPSSFLFYKLSKSQFSSSDMKPLLHSFSPAGETCHFLLAAFDKRTSNFTLAFHHISSVPEHPSIIISKIRNVKSQTLCFLEPYRISRMLRDAVWRQT